MRRTRSISLMAEPLYDIAVIGSGIASSLTLCRLAERLQGMPVPIRTLCIAVIEKQDEQWSGIPYGQRSSKGALTFQRLSEFLHQPERGEFIEWLKEHQNKWLATFLNCGGPSAARWLLDNQSKIDRDQWDELYLPRFLFGQYVSQRTEGAVAQLAEAGLATITFIYGEATGVSRPQAELYTVQVKGAQPHNVRAQRVVLAIGSPPQKAIHSKPAEDDYSHTHIADLYSPAEDLNLIKIEHALADTRDRRKANILIVGSNASALETLYLITYRTEIRDLVNSIVVLSRAGKLPHKITDLSVEFKLTALEELNAAACFSAADLMTAITLDLQRASAQFLNLADLRDPVGALVGDLIRKMHVSEQKQFVCAHGLSYSRMMRRAGRDTCAAADELIKLGILTTIKGDFHSLLPASDGLMAVVYSSPEADLETVHPTLFSITINCCGFEELNFCTSPLIQSLLTSNICRVNSTDRGFLLNERLEASKNFYVIGPLAGGNFNDKIRFWHVESASRISTLADQLADSLYESLLCIEGGQPPARRPDAPLYENPRTAPQTLIVA